MKVGDAVRYSRGNQQWVGIVTKIYSGGTIGASREILLVDVVMEDGVFTYKDWKLEVISEVG